MESTPPTRLITELQVFEANKQNWLKTRRDKYVVIRGREILDFFSSFHEGYLAGIAKFGANTEFLVKRVLEHEPVFVVF
jgi:hypothetical protein